MQHLRWLSCLLFAAAVVPSALAQNNLSEPAIPADPLEFVTGDAQVVTTAEARAQILALLNRAHALSNIRSGAYDLKSTVTSFGSGSNEGSWQLEDTSPAPGFYRWTVQGPTYSATNLYNNQLLYSNHPAGAAPLRLQQVRTAIFFAFLNTAFQRSALIRAAGATYSGRRITCVLLSGMNPPPLDRGRLWEETEYCIDRSSGLLLTYSAAPGSYVLYDYSKTLQLNGSVIPTKITITEAGTPTVEAQLQSLTTPAHASVAAFTPPAGATPIGAGPLMAAPSRFPIFIAEKRGTPGSSVQPVIVHGVMNPEGRIVETEIAQTSNPSLNQRALSVVQQWQGRSTAPGATPLQREVFVNVKFVN